MNKISIKFIAESAIIAALYVAVTWALAPISYGAIQFRLSEVLMLLVLLNPRYAIPLVIGCFIANTTSPLGWPDMVFGTLATVLAILPMLKIKNLYLGALMPVVSNAIIVSIELGIVFDMFQPAAFFYNVFTIALGEVVVLYLVGIPAVISMSKNSVLVEMMELDMSNVKSNSYFNLSRVLAFTLAAIGIIFFIAYPVFKEIREDGTSYISFMSALKDYWFVIFIGLIPLLYLINYLFINSNLKHIIGFSLAIALIAPFVAICVLGNKEFSVYYYFYPIYIVLLGLIPVLEYKKIIVNK